MSGNMLTTRNTAQDEPHTSKHGGMLWIGMKSLVDMQMLSDSLVRALFDRLIIGADVNQRPWPVVLRVC